MVQKLVSALIAIVIGLALFPVIADTIANLTQAPDVGEGILAGPFYDTTIGALINVLPILYIIIVFVGVIGFVAYKK